MPSLLPASAPRGVLVAPTFPHLHRSREASRRSSPLTVIRLGPSTRPAHDRGVQGHANVGSAGASEQSAGAEWEGELRPRPGAPREGGGGGCTKEGAPAAGHRPATLSLAPLCHRTRPVPFHSCPCRLPRFWASSCRSLETGIGGFRSRSRVQTVNGFSVLKDTHAADAGARGSRAQTCSFRPRAVGGHLSQQEWVASS